LKIGAEECAKILRSRGPAAWKNLRAESLPGFPVAWKPSRKPHGPAFAHALRVNPKAAALQDRTRAFLVGVIALCKSIPDSDAKQSIAPQLIDSAGAVGSNYREACRARSTREFIAKVGIACQEADESKGWLETLPEAGLCSRDAAGPLIDEANQLLAILTASQKTARRNAAAKSGRDDPSQPRK
jgi:four helix bundle protein